MRLKFSPMIYYLIYLSDTVNIPSREELNQLLTESRSLNEEHGLTGILVYIEGRYLTHSCGRFMQVLEGSRFVVERVFDKIKRDDRHDNIIVLKRGTIEKRNFNSWHMGFEIFSLEENSNLEGFFHFNQDLLESEEFVASDAPLDFLKSFYEAHKNVKII